jgi:D-amino-acid dehydrogenase
VIGGGIVGSSAAYRLARRGVRVTLIDRADQGHATAAGAGIVLPATSFRAPPAQNSLAYRAAAYYPELVASLRDDVITGTGYATPWRAGGRVRRRGRCPAEPRVPDSG